MAANTTLASATTLPARVYLGSIGTTWQEFTVPYEMVGFRDVHLYASAAFYVAFDADGATDGGAVGSNPTPGAATTWTSLGPWSRDVTKRSQSFFCAAQTGTINIWAVAVGGN